MRSGSTSFRTEEPISSCQLPLVINQKVKGFRFRLPDSKKPNLKDYYHSTREKFNPFIPIKHLKVSEP